MIWLVGNKGMLGCDMETQLASVNWPYLATDRELDISDSAELVKYFLGKKISKLTAIINCAAYTAVDLAEDNRKQAFKVNCTGVRNLAQLALSMDAVLVHFSTDYVFDGRKPGEYLESDETAPLGVYGSSKQAGEEMVIDSISKYYIIRTAWLFGKHNKNFVYTMLDLFKKLKKVKVVADQWGNPTYTRDLAEAIIAILRFQQVNKNPRYGVYHFTNLGSTNWYEFALAIYHEARRNGFTSREITIQAISTDEYPTKAKRPANSRLSKRKIVQTFGLKIKSWQDALCRFLREIKEE